MKRTLTVVLAFVVVVAVVVAVIYAFGNRKAVEGRGVLPPPPPASEIKYAGPKSSHPYASVSPGVLTRTIYRTESPDFNIEIRDVVIGPGKQLPAQSFHGTAVMEVDAGKGAAGLGERKAELHGGLMTLAPSQTRIRLSNTGVGPLLVHLYVIEGK